MANNDELNYPNLCSCKVELMSSTIGSKPPVKLPQDCIDVLNNVEIPLPYDFALGTYCTVLPVVLVQGARHDRLGMYVCVYVHDGNSIKPRKSWQFLF